MTASLLQPLVGLYADRRAMPFSLAIGMGFTFAGLLLLGFADSYPVLLLAAAVIGVGSSVFHPESSRVARMASGGRHGLAQSLFQVGGNVGSAMGPLAGGVCRAGAGAAASIAWFSLFALLSIAVLWRVGRWYKDHGLARMRRASTITSISTLPRGKVLASVGVLLALIFSKYFYLASITSYYTFYLIHQFHLSVQRRAAASVSVSGGGGGGHDCRRADRRSLGPQARDLGLDPGRVALHAGAALCRPVWTGALSVVIGLLLASAFPAIVVYGQELMPGKVGMVSGMFFGFAFGMGGLGAALIGALADATSIEFVYRICAFLPSIGLLAAFLPDLDHRPAAA